MKVRNDRKTDPAQVLRDAREWLDYFAECERDGSLTSQERRQWEVLSQLVQMASRGQQ